ncbi:hypothetical protein AB6A40_000154 [Gnathostoma spinigerum]|uniref:Rho GTPase-activating protein n=1 Tax=Gnathostoma spinigerum TaxID=75299 RepID=A0ABD6E1I4_9BILA
MSAKCGGSTSGPDLITIAVLGVSGTERYKGTAGVGKSLICNRFVRGSYDEFHIEHSSILSQADFGGSPVINNDHWLYWGESNIDIDESHPRTRIRLIEQTEFVDDETFEPHQGCSEDYAKRATRIKLESADKLMYICKEQLGLEMEFEHHVLPDGRVSIDAFIFVYDISVVGGRSFEQQSELAVGILLNAIKTKKPVIVAASKADIADENGRKSLQRLLSRKELRSAGLCSVEVSAVANVNITGLFTYITALTEKWKVKVKPPPYAEAVKLQKAREAEVNDRYVAFLREIMPVEEWLSCRPTWQKLMNRIDMTRNFTQFVHIFGHAKAKLFYERHVNEARELWMQRRLQLQAPKLTNVFADLLGTDRAMILSWNEAKEAIYNHPLFDEYFQPLGVFGADLTPSSPQMERWSGDKRIPAELLLAPDAELIYLDFQRIIERDCCREKLEEQFEQVLANCSQVTPGKPLHEVEIFLRGNAVYDALPSSVALKVFDKFQESLVKRAESDFSELLLENVQLFLGIVLLRNHNRAFRPLLGLENSEMAKIKSLLHEDARYRNLNRLFEFRDKKIVNYASFVSYPLVQNCPAGSRCVDALFHDIFRSHLQRRQVLEASQMLIIKLAIVGSDSVVNDFTRSVSKVIRGDMFENERGFARLQCFSEAEAGTNALLTHTFVFLIDSLDTLEKVRARSLKSDDFCCAPIFTLVVDPTHIDLLPYLHQQCCSLSDMCNGCFISPGSELLSSSRHASDNDLSTIFSKDQISRVLEASFLSQTDGHRIDFRVQLLLMCGDPFPAHCILTSLLANAAHITPSSAGGMSTIEVLLSSMKRSSRIDLRVSSYHSWLASRKTVPIHGHILVYSARRRASLAHTVVAARRLAGPLQASAGKSILIVAVADVTDFFNDEETNALLTEGSELANELSAAFVTLSPEGNERLHARTFLEFFERLQLSVQRQVSNAVINTRIPIISDTANSHSGNIDAPLRTDATNLARSNHNSGSTLQSDSSAPRSRDSTNSSRKSDRQLLLPSDAFCSLDSVTEWKDSIIKHHLSTSHCSRKESIFAVVPENLSRAEIHQTVAAELAITFNNPSRLPVASDDSEYAFEMHQQHEAPLATPEPFEVASEYMSVLDALDCRGEREPIYAAVDFSCAPRGMHERSRNSSRANHSRPRKPLQKGSNAATTVLSCQSIFTSHDGSASSSSSASTTHPLSSECVKAVYSCQCLAEASTSARTCQFGQLPGENEMRSHQNHQVSLKGIHRLHSISAESLVDVGIINSSNLYGHLNDGSTSDAKKHLKNRFVRKVTSSFRFRKSGRINSTLKKTFDDVDEDDEPSQVENGSQSVPHSPFVERSKLAITGRRQPPSSNEKISNAFSWLPSRSPKRNLHNISGDSDGLRSNGVILANETLQSLAACSHDRLPVFVRKCIEYIEQGGGMDTEGLYRVPGNQAQVIQLERYYMLNNDVNFLSLDIPVHAVATALKNFFSSLPEPLIPYSLHDRLVGCLECDPSTTMERLQLIVQALPEANERTCNYLMQHLFRVSQHSSTNSMDVRNLSKVWWPTLFRPNFETFESMAVFVTRLELTTQLLIKSASSNCDANRIPSGVKGRRKYLTPKYGTEV